MNKIEYILMHNPLRWFFQNRIFKNFLKPNSDLKKGSVILEVGCGNEIGVKLIKKYFKPAKIYATDLDERMIKYNLKKNKDNSVVYEVADASRLRFENDFFDAIVFLGVVHHIPNWQKVLEELKRVLKTEGEIIFKEASIETFQTPLGKICKKLESHPYKEMYGCQEFVDYLKKINFKIKHFKRHKPFYNLLNYFTVVAKK